MAADLRPLGSTARRRLLVAPGPHSGALKGPSAVPTELITPYLRSLRNQVAITSAITGTPSRPTLHAAVARRPSARGSINFAYAVLDLFF